MAERFIDLSSNNPHPIDFRAVKESGVAGVVLKATEGTDYINPDFASDLRQAKAAGLHVAAYGFTRPEQGNPEAQVDYFRAEIQRVGVAVEWYALDAETGSGNLTSFVLVALGRAAGYFGQNQTVLYTGGWWAGEHLDGDPRLANYQLWDASYTQQQPSPPRPWAKLFGWQYTDRAQVPGISGGVDESLVFTPIPLPAQAKGGTMLAPRPNSNITDAFVKGTDGLLYTFTLSPGGKATPPFCEQPWKEHPINELLGVAWNGGELQVLVLGTDAQVYLTRFVAGGADWTPFESLGFPAA